MKYYLAYGSNLNVEQMKYRCPHARKCGTSKIQDYELVFRRGFLTIEPKKGSFVPVGIWEITDEDERNLDRYEGYPRFYTKKDIPMAFTGWDHDGNSYVMHKNCLVYIMNPGFPIEPPSVTYVRTVNQGYADFGFDMDDWEKLIQARMRSEPSFYTTVSTTKVDPK